MGRHVAQGGDLLLAPRAAGRAALRARQTCVLGLHCIAAPAKEVGRFCRHATGRTSARRRCRLGRADQDHGDDQQPAATDRIPDEVGQARRLQHGDHDTRGDQRGGRESPSQRARRAGSGGTRTAMIVRPSAAPTVRPGRAGGGASSAAPRPSPTGRRGRSCRGRRCRRRRVRRIAGTRCRVGAGRRRLQREAERGGGQEEHEHQPGDGSEPAPTTRLQDAPSPQLHRYPPADGVDQREQPAREVIRGGSASR